MSHTFLIAPLPFRRYRPTPHPSSSTEPTSQSPGASATPSLPVASPAALAPPPVPAGGGTFFGASPLGTSPLAARVGPALAAPAASPPAPSTALVFGTSPGGGAPLGERAQFERERANGGASPTPRLYGQVPALPRAFFGRVAEIESILRFVDQCHDRCKVGTW